MEPNSTNQTIPQIPQTPQNPHGLTLKVVFAVLLAFILGGAAVYLWQNPQVLNSLPFMPQPKACTMEAKLCPDGSSVGRTPPDCEFTPCPDIKSSIPEETTNWKIYINKSYGFEFKYPQDWEVGDSEGGLPSSVLQWPQKNYFLEINIISPEQLNLMGITYCAANINDILRCESLKVDKNIDAVIDWGVDNENKTKALVQIADPSGGMITFNLSPINSETKSFLYNILSTFRFTE